MITVRPPKKGGFVDVFQHARQHLLRVPPRRHHVPLVPHLHALVVMEKTVLDIKIYLCSLALLGHGFTLCSALQFQRRWCCHQAQTHSGQVLGLAHRLWQRAQELNLCLCWPHSVQSKETPNCCDDSSLTRAPKFCWTHPQRVLPSSSSLHAVLMTLSAPYEKSKFLQPLAAALAPVFTGRQVSW